MIAKTFTVEEVSSRAELDAVVECIWAVMGANNPPHHIFFPILGDCSTALEESKQRLWDEHSSDPSSHWILVRDLAGDGTAVLGTCQRRFYDQNPFPDGVPEFVATWWPDDEGGGRAFATEFLRQVLMPRATWMARRHAGLSWCAVLPDQRRRGIGRAMMSWGLKRADALGIESFIEASALGSELYRTCGYRAVARINIDMAGKGSGAEWKKLQKRLLPFSYDAMSRLLGGEQTDAEFDSIWTQRSVRDYDQL